MVSAKLKKLIPICRWYVGIILTKASHANGLPMSGSGSTYTISLLVLIKFWEDSEGVPYCSPHNSEAGVGVGMEVASILATFLTDVEHRSKMVTKSCLSTWLTLVRQADKPLSVSGERLSAHGCQERFPVRGCR